jgi:hypothetical protein
MTDDRALGCEEVRELAPDLAIGIADGQERDAALRHAATCLDCRRLVAELASVVDDLLPLAPSHQPPPGFAARTAARMVPPVARPRRWAIRPAIGRLRSGRRWATRLAVAASLVLALALGAGAVYRGTASDRRLAASYREVLAQAHGSFFAAAPVRGPTGTLGTVFAYQGQPSWMYATLTLPAGRPERFGVLLVTRDGRQLSLGSVVLGGGQGAWGAGIPVALTEVRQLRFVTASGQTVLAASFNVHDPWHSS